jgi:MFS family permease
MADASSIWKPPLAPLTLGLALVVVAMAFEALAVATILPTTTAELGGLGWYGWIFSAFMLANIVGITVGGTQTDRRGPAAPFVAGMVLFAGGLVLSGFAPSMAVIVALIT